MSKNKQLRKAVGSAPCVACGSPPPNDPDHVITYATRLKDEALNMWSLCRSCHGEKGRVGIITFVRVNNLEGELERRGFERTFDGKWFIPASKKCEFTGKTLVLTECGWDEVEQ